MRPFSCSGLFSDVARSFGFAFAIGQQLEYIPYYLTYSTPSVISRPRLLVAVLLSKIRLLPAARMAVLSYKSCVITEVILRLFFCAVRLNLTKLGEIPKPEFWSFDPEFSWIRPWVLFFSILSFMTFTLSFCIKLLIYWYTLFVKSRELNFWPQNQQFCTKKRRQR